MPSYGYEKTAPRKQPTLTEAPMAKGKKELHHLHFVPAHVNQHHDGDGKPMHTVEHHYSSPHETEIHHFAQDDGPALMAHLAKHGKVTGVTNAESNHDIGMAEGSDKKDIDA